MLGTAELVLIVGILQIAVGSAAYLAQHLLFQNMPVFQSWIIQQLAPDAVDFVKQEIDQLYPQQAAQQPLNRYLFRHQIYSHFGDI